MKLLEVDNLSVTMNRREIVRGLSFSLSSGDWLMLIGPNGAGKSTVVNAIAGAAPYAGRILFRGRDISGMKSAEMARHIGVLSQQHSVGYSFTVGEVVRLGRYAWNPGPFSRRSGEDERAVSEALRITGLSDMTERNVLTLSGGELQRTFLAQLFAQEPEILVLDEPTNHLDLPYQREIFGLIRQWLRTPGRAVISVVHDLSLARRYATKGLLLCDGAAAAAGPGESVFVSRVLEQVYGMDVAAWLRELYGQWET